MNYDKLLFFPSSSSRFVWFFFQLRTQKCKRTLIPVNRYPLNLFVLVFYPIIWNIKKLRFKCCSLFLLVRSFHFFLSRASLCLQYIEFHRVWQQSNISIHVQRHPHLHLHIKHTNTMKQVNDCDHYYVSHRHQTTIEPAQLIFSA